jgi:hypothetical protein
MRLGVDRAAVPPVTPAPHEPPVEHVAPPIRLVDHVQAGAQVRQSASARQRLQPERSRHLVADDRQSLVHAMPGLARI